MKNIKIFVAMVFVTLFIADSLSYGQVSLRYERNTRHSRLSLTYSSGWYYGYGYDFSPGFIIQRGGTTFTFGTNFLGYNYAIPRGYLYYPSYGYNYALPYGFSHYPYYRYNDFYEPYDYRYYSPLYERYEEPPKPRTRDTKIEVTGTDINDGLKKFKEMNYKDAQNAFRNAVVSSTDTVTARILFGISLFVEGEYALAEKSLRSAVREAQDTSQITSINIENLFKNKDEFDKQFSILVKKLDKQGAVFVAGYIYLVNGDKANAKNLFQKILSTSPNDKVAKRLLDYIEKGK